MFTTDWDNNYKRICFGCSENEKQLELFPELHPPHEVIEIDAGFTKNTSCWGSGVPVTKEKCTKCGQLGSGMVSADIVGGGY